MENGVPKDEAITKVKQVAAEAHQERLKLTDHPEKERRLRPKREKSKEAENMTTEEITTYFFSNKHCTVGCIHSLDWTAGQDGLLDWSIV